MNNRIKFLTKNAYQSLPLMILGCLFIYGILLRFIRLSDIGIIQPDAFFYWQTAFEWLHGNETLTEHFRPFIYWLDSEVMNIFGMKEDTLRYFNAGLDCIIAALLLFSGKILNRNWLFGLCASVSYLFLLEPLKSARGETVQTISALFILISVFFLIKWTKKKRVSYSFFAGLFLGMAWNTHPDLAVLGLPFTLVFFLKLCLSEETNENNFGIEFFKVFSLFLIGYFLIFIVFLAKFGIPEVLGNLTANHQSQTKNLQGSFFWRLGYFSYHYLRINLGKTGLILIIGSGLLAINKWAKGRITSLDLSLFLPPLFYLILCALLFARTLIPRLFIPLIPISILFIYLQAFDYFKTKYRIGLYVITIVFLFSNLPTFRWSFDEPISVYKHLDKEFSPLLNKNSKFLITPLSTNHIHSPLSNNVYVNGSGVYLASTVEQNYEEIIKNNKITHLWIADILYDQRIFGKNFKKKYAERLMSLYGITREDYNLENEKKYVRNMLSARHAKLIHKSVTGELYEL